MSLPKGYLDFGHNDYAALDVETARAVYVKVREIAAYFIGTKEVDNAVRAGSPVTPADWIVGVKRLKCKCERCSGRGIYYWGACVNGRMSHSAPCARCAGKGEMNFEDMRRSKAYDNYAIVRACRV